jgi:hypothetical protein
MVGPEDGLGKSVINLPKIEWPTLEVSISITRGCGCTKHAGTDKGQPYAYYTRPFEMGDCFKEYHNKNRRT